MRKNMTESLPGMPEIPEPVNRLANAAEKYINSLESLGLIEDHHVLKVELVRTLATVAGKAGVRGQAAAVAMASAQLREAMAELPQPLANDDFSKFMDELKQVPTTQEP